MHLGTTSKGLLALAFFALIWSGGAHAAQVTKVDGEKVFIDFKDGEDIQPGGRFIVVVGGKKRAVVEIVKVKGTRALAKNLKGKPDVGGELTPLTAASRKSGGSTASSSGSRRRRGSESMFGDMTYGALVGYDMATQEVTSTNSGTGVSTTISMTGAGYSLKGFGDLPIAGDLGLLGRLGVTQFSVKGGSLPSGEGGKTDITYAVADLLLRYNFGESGLIPYGLAGLGLHFPLSKTSNVLDVQRVSATTVFFLGGGFHYTQGESSYFTLDAEYGMFPPSNDVKTSMIAARAGMGFRF